MISIFIRSLTRALMFLVAKILHQNSHYLEVPEDLLSTMKADQILRMYHFLPAVIIAIVITVKVFPLMSTWYATELEVNGRVIPLTFILILPAILILVGIVIEKILCRTNEQYAAFIKSNGKS